VASEGAAAAEAALEAELLAEEEEEEEEAEEVRPSLRERTDAQNVSYPTHCALMPPFVPVRVSYHYR